MIRARHRVHARGLRLTCDEWLAVLGLPSVCATLGKRCPKWAWALCQHADATRQAVPGALLEALARGEPHERTAGCEREAASVGEAIGLCVVRWSEGPTVPIMPTPFGFAVAFLHTVRQCERIMSRLDGVPWRSRFAYGEAPPLDLSREALPPSIDTRAIATSSPLMVGGEGGSGAPSTRPIRGHTSEPGRALLGGVRPGFHAGEGST